MNNQSFRAQFAPAIHKVIASHTGQRLSIIQAALRREWSRIKTPENEYMQSTWSREATRQLATHGENQSPISELPLFKKKW